MHRSLSYIFIHASVYIASKEKYILSLRTVLIEFVCYKFILVISLVVILFYVVYDILLLLELPV